ncbi:MAG: NmrA family NAD(P)-binding protein [Deltaproteobacteria bacterium]|nr:NmrA family NAD(P)-binding protein [Deltaproteobacteria bacterium]
MTAARNKAPLHVVTGAFGYSGKYIARRLMAEGVRLRTLTNSIDRENEFGNALEIHPYNFENPEVLAGSLADASVLYNTYWVRFDHKEFNHDKALRNTLTLIGAAKKAGVKRIVHTSITNPSEDSDLPYFKCKALLERAVRDSGIPYAILRPTVLFGKEDILINNIAWMLRCFPVFAIFGDGKYKLQPIYVDDFAALAVEQGKKSGHATIDAVGPETFAYRELVEAIGCAIGKKKSLINVPPQLVYLIGRLVGAVVGDVVITMEEIRGLMANRLYTSSSPAGPTRFTDWMADHAGELGKHYSSELARRRDRRTGYDVLRKI